MAVIDHGLWVKYVPAVYPFDVPSGAVFCRRESDGHDWYEYVNVIEGVEHHKNRKRRFELDSIKFVIEVEGRDESRDPIIRTAAVDASRLFPAGCRLIELTDVRREQNEGALIEEFVNRRFDLKTGRINSHPGWKQWKHG